MCVEKYAVGRGTHWCPAAEIAAMIGTSDERPKPDRSCSAKTFFCMDLLSFSLYGNTVQLKLRRYCPVCISAYNEKPFLSTHLSARIHIMYLNFPIGCGII